MMTRQEICEACENLPDQYKKIMKLYYCDNFTQNEIAKYLGISLYKVKGSLTKGMYILRSLSKDPELVKAKRMLKSG